MCEINYLMEQANQSSTEKGFWKDYDDMIKKMKALSGHFTQKDLDRLKLAFYNEKISLISSELGEATEAMRTNKYCELTKEQLEIMFNIQEEIDGYRDFKYQASYQTHIKDTFQDEIADAMIRLLDLCYKMDIDIEKFIILKMEYNKLRDVKHGKKF
jgi:NTP pyrophosphatase (non-canonical NTP hydrolase)